MAEKPTIREHLSKHDREIAAIRKLVLTGMKMLVRLETSQRELQASQRETDKELKILIRSLRGGTNGHAKRKVNLP